MTGPARLVAALTVASRVLGMLREVAFASIFGAGAVADAFRIAFQLPNTFRRIFGEGALASALVPVLSRVRERTGLPAVWRAAGAILGMQGAVLGALVLLGTAAIWIATPWAAARSADPEKARLTGHLAALLFPYMILICMTASQGAVLNVLDSFLVPALAPVLFNVVCLAGLGAAGWLVASGAGAGEAIWWVAGAVLAAGGVQYASQSWGLARRGGALGRVRLRLDARDGDFREVSRGMVPIVAGLAPAQVGVLLDTLIAEVFVARDGAVAHLGYGHVLVHLPLAIIGVSIATTSFPLFSRLGARGDRQGLAEAVSRSGRQMAALLLPAAVGLAFFAEPVVRLVYGRGEFDAGAVLWTARVTAAYAAGLVAYGLQQLLVRGLYALGDRRGPARVGLATVAAGVGLNLVLVRYWEEPGIALASAAASWLGLAATAALLARRLAGASFDRKGLALAAGRTLLGCAALAGWLHLARPWCEGGGWAGGARTLGAVLCGVFVYLGVAWAAGSQEVRELFSRARAR